MAGIYIHIPFCKQACYYCDFHFSSYLALKDDLIKALVKEIEWQKNFFPGPVETIYFGGGTPSLLNAYDLEKIFTSLSKSFSYIDNPEITLEANPDDMSIEKLKILKEIGVNRLSMGIQTFDNNLLKYLNRIHTSDEAIKSFERARSLGFQNINCDLIYSIPGQDDKILHDDLKKMTDLQPEHISAYCLTIEEKTVFGNWLRKNKFHQMDEDKSAEQMEKVWDYLNGAGYEQYEISNFCRSGYYSKHNLSYWQDKMYLGLGPGAHSYNGISRSFNISNNSIYIKSITNGVIPCTIDNLTTEDCINEYILTSLRTIWGCDVNHLKNKHHILLLDIQSDIIKNLIGEGLVKVNSKRIFLTKKGKPLADHISSKLFVHS